MDRKEFLLSVCALCGAGAALTALQGCSKDTAGPGNINFTLDLTQSSNSALGTVGGHVISNNVYVTRTGTSSFLALYLSCTHEGAIVNLSGQQFVCPRHGATFALNGDVTGGPASSNLAHCSVTQSGQILTIIG